MKIAINDAIDVIVLGGTFAFAYLLYKIFKAATSKQEPPTEMNRTIAEAALVDEARRLLVSSGNAQSDVARAMQALAALVEAVRIKDGDAAAGALLERGRNLFKEREGTDDERDHALESLETKDSF